MKYDNNYNPVDELFGKNKNTNFDNQEVNNINQDNSINLNINTLDNNGFQSDFNNGNFDNNGVPNIDNSVQNNNLNQMSVENNINSSYSYMYSDDTSDDSSYNNGNKKKNKNIIFIIIGILLFIIAIIVIYFFISNKNKEQIKEEISVLTDKIEIKAVGFEFNEPFDNNRYEYTLEIDTDQVQIKCNKSEQVEGCNKTISLKNKENYKHSIKYVSTDGKEHIYTININKKQNTNPIKIDSIEISKTEYSNEKNKIIVYATSDNKSKLEYSFDGGNTWQKSNEYEVESNGEFNVVIKDEDGNKTENKVVEISNIDKIKPVVDIVIKEQTKEKIILYANAKDELSGIDLYSWNNGTYLKTTTYEVTKAGTYTVMVKDLAGNISSQASINIPESSFKTEVKKEQKKYTVKLISNGAIIDKNEVSCTTYDISCKVVLPNIIKENSIIIGWAEEKNSREAKYKTLEEIELTSNKTLYAITAKKLTATFVSNGAEISGSETKNCNIYNNETTCTIKTPAIVRNGWNILGFDENSNSKTVKYKSSSNITLSSDITLYAITKKTNVVTIDSNGAIVGDNLLKCNMYNNDTKCSIKLPSITKTGWNVLGFAETKDAKSGKYKQLTNIDVSSNKTLYAITKKVNIVTINGNGATVSDSSLSCEIYNSDTKCSIKLPSITKAGWQILGFAETKDAKSEKYKQLTNIDVSWNKTLYAITKKTNKLTFYGNGATVSDSSLKCEMYNTQTFCSIKTPTITRQGWQILGFSGSAGATTTKYKQSTNINVSSNETLYAITQKKLMVSFYVNGSKGTNSFETCNLYNKQTTCNIMTPKIVRDGWQVLGYSSNKSATSATYKPLTKISVSVNSPTNLYAITKKDITVKFEIDNENTLGYKNFDYLEYSSKTCSIYNTQTYCEMKMPLADIKGLIYIGFLSENRGAYYSYGRKIRIYENTTMYSYFAKENYVHFVDIRNNLAHSFKYENSSGVVFVDIEKGCNVVNYMRYFDIIKRSDLKFLLDGNSKIMILKQNTFKNAYGAFGRERAIGFVYPNNNNYPLVYVDCEGSASSENATLVHELAHKWDHAVKSKTGTLISDNFKDLYDKYVNSSNRPLRDYSYTNTKEFFAESFTAYYFKYIFSNPNLFPAKWDYPEDIKTRVEKYINLYKQ